MKLEYIIIFKEGGIPIYSSCYGSFCARVGFDESLYSGFLSALTTMPSMFGDEQGLQTVELGHTKLHFSKTSPSGHNICVGIDKSTCDDIDVNDQLDIFYQKINDLLENQYKAYNWIETTKEEIDQFEDNLIHKAIFPIFPYFKDGEVCSEECPFDHDGQVFDPETNQPFNIVDRFVQNYDKHLSWFYKLIGWFYLRIYRWFDLRSYRKQRTLYQKKENKRP